jgi:hypothetical protein
LQNLSSSNGESFLLQILALLEDCPIPVGENLLAEPVSPLLLENLLDKTVKTLSVKDNQFFYLFSSSCGRRTFRGFFSASGMRNFERLMVVAVQGFSSYRGAKVGVKSVQAASAKCWM